MFRFLIAFAILCIDSHAAGLLLQPPGAFTEFRDLNDVSDFGPSNTIDQSGLLIPYESLVTDFDAYVAQTVSNIFDSGNAPLAAPSIFLGEHSSTWVPEELETWIAFDLGAATPISGLALWNYPGFGPPMKAFTVSVSNSVDFLNSTMIGTFTAADNSLSLLYVEGESFSATPVQTFSFPQETARYVKVEVLTSWAEPFPPGGFCEIAFKTVPEPGSALLLTACGCLLASRRGSRSRR